MDNEHTTALPKGPVLCDTCKQAGRSVEMEHYDPDTPANRERAEPTTDQELQTYRCPICENTSVFRFT